MQFKLLTLALFASFFATGFTAAVYPGLTAVESATISPLVKILDLENPTKEQAGCIAYIVKDIMHFPLNGRPMFPPHAFDLIPNWISLYQYCLDNPKILNKAMSMIANHDMQ
ncbi:hypothetical protein RMATCC62417_18538 [Rhizopus microsporus]|nr:hypothetical protein RMATCC62417_18538 [Rhizopus microsporus]